MQKKRRIPILTGAVTVLLAGSLAAGLALLNQAERPDATGYISEAETHLLDRKFQSATIAVKNALQLEPNNGKARLVHARLLINAGKGAEALAELERAERAGVQGIRPYRLRAQLIKGEFAKVLGTLAVDPDSQKDTALLIIRAQAALALGRLDNAASAFETALALSPDSREAQIGSAETALKAGRAGKAAQFIAPLLREDARDSRVSLLHGEIALRQKDPATALAAFRTAKAQRATLAADIGQVRALIGLEDLKAAQSLADSLAAAHPKSPAAHYWQAAAAAKMGRTEAAITAYRAVLGLTPKHPESLFSISRLQIERGQFSEAEAALQRLIKVAPKHLPSRKLLAIAQLKNGNPQESMETLDPGQDQRLADDPHALALRAAALRQIGDTKGADTLLARATEIAPEEPAYRVERALGQLSSGQVKAALASLHQAIEIEPEHHKAHALIVLAALAEEDLDSALAQAENYAKRYTSTAFAHNLHAGVLRRAGKLEQAREALHRAVAIDPAFADAQVNLARIEREKGNIELARSRLEKLVSERTHPAVLSELASIALARGAPLEALE